MDHFLNNMNLLCSMIKSSASAHALIHVQMIVLSTLKLRVVIVGMGGRLVGGGRRGYNGDK